MFAKAVIVAVLALAMVGCAPHRDLIAAGALRLEQPPQNDRHLRSISAYERDGTLSVSGTWSVPPRSGHVDVTLLSPEGDVLAETRTKLVLPLHHRQRHPSRFYTELDTVPPDRSVLRVVIHFGDHPLR